jgi:hypothetical protein
LTSPYLERPLRSLEEARRDRHDAHATAAAIGAAGVDFVSADDDVVAFPTKAETRRANGLAAGRLRVAILVIVLAVAGMTAWSLSRPDMPDEEAMARELNALTPAAGSSAPTPTRLIGEAAPSAEPLGPSPVFRP